VEKTTLYQLVVKGSETILLKIEGIYSRHYLKAVKQSNYHFFWDPVDRCHEYTVHKLNIIILITLVLVFSSGQLVERLVVTCDGTGPQNNRMALFDP
jgi:hypothetical protein